MRDHAGEFRFVLREHDEPGVDADVTAGQRERVDLRVGHREELEVLLGIGGRVDEAVAELVQVVVDFRIVEIAARRADLAHDGLADLALLRRRERDLRRIAEVGQGLRLGVAKQGRRRDGRAREQHGECEGERLPGMPCPARDRRK